MLTFSKDRVIKKFQTIDNQTKDSEKNLQEGEELHSNASKLIDEARTGYDRISYFPGELEGTNAALKKVLDENDADIAEIKVLQPKAQEHAQNLSQRAQELDNLLSETRDSSNDALTAANAYKNIVDAIKNASHAANEGLKAGEDAARQLEGVENKSLILNDKSEEFFTNATDLSSSDQNLTEPLKLNLQRYLPSQEQHNKNKEALESLEKLLNLKQQLSHDALKEAKDVAGHAETFANNTRVIAADEFKEVSISDMKS